MRWVHIYLLLFCFINFTQNWFGTEKTSSIYSLLRDKIFSVIDNQKSYRLVSCNWKILALMKEVSFSQQGKLYIHY